jgi:hypothetical protein
MNVGIGTEAAQFLFWEYINGSFVAVGSVHKEVVILREGTGFFFALCINNLDYFIVC